MKLLQISALRTDREMRGILCISLHCQSVSLEQEGLNRRWGHSLLYMITHTHTPSAYESTSEQRNNKTAVFVLAC